MKMTKMTKMMKALRICVPVAGILSVALLFNSCLDDSGYSLGEYRMEIATVESLESSRHYFRLDDGTTLWPAAGYYLGHNMEDGQRTWLNYTILSDAKDGFDHYIKVNGVDSILTKKIAEDKGEENNAVYGTDPVGVDENNIWIGNGYLNMIFSFNYGGTKKHFVNLLSAGDEENAYRVEFRHNAYDDPQGMVVSGIVCFNLSDLPDTGGETVKLTVVVNTFDGVKTYELDYNSNREQGTGTGTESSGFNLENFERVN
jgi:hypothetical protein